MIRHSCLVVPGKPAILPPLPHPTQRSPPSLFNLFFFSLTPHFILLPFLPLYVYRIRQTTLTDPLFNHRTKPESYSFPSTTVVKFPTWVTMRWIAATVVLTLFLSFNLCFAVEAPSPAPAVNSPKLPSPSPVISTPASAPPSLLPQITPWTSPKASPIPSTPPSTSPTPSSAAPRVSLTPLISPPAHPPISSPSISAVVPVASPKAGSSPVQSPRPLTPWGRTPAASPVTAPSMSPIRAPTAGPVQSPLPNSPPTPTSAEPSEDMAPAPSNDSSVTALRAAAIFRGLAAVIGAALVI